MSVRIGNGCGFWGDRLDAPLQLAPHVDYLTLDYLSEMSLSIMAVQQESHPELGYAKDFIEAMKSLIGQKCKVVTNAGGLNPRGCAKQLKGILPKGTKIGIVTGDNVSRFFPGAHTANAYLGADGLVKALSLGADIVVAGRIADPSLTVACARHHFGWKSTDYDLIAQATVAGHLIECGAQVTGGLMDDWLDQPRLEEIGYPIAEIEQDGSFFITKPPGTGGSITLRGIKEQLLYEMGDPGAYLSPDATVNLLNLEINGLIKGAKGAKPPATYKVSLSKRKGYAAHSEIGLVGDNLHEKGEKIQSIILQRLRKRGFHFDKTHYSLIGWNGLSPYVPSYGFEAMFRMGVQSGDKQAVEAFTKEMAPFITCGPMGVCAYVGGRSSVRPLFVYQPEKIERSKVEAQVEMLTCN